MSLQTDFIIKFPEFDPIDQPSFDSAVDDVDCLYNVEYVDANGTTTCGNLSILYLVAHFYYLDQQTTASPSRVETSKSVGDVSASYMVGSASEFIAFYSSTKYGQRFLVMNNAQGGFFV